MNEVGSIGKLWGVYGACRIAQESYVGMSVFLQLFIENFYNTMC